MQGSSASDICSMDRPPTEPAGSSRTNDTSEQGSGRWMDVITIALGQTLEGKWYTSTLDLQLTSFENCVACRGVRTLRVTVDKHMSLSLWGDVDCLGDCPKAPGKRRVPALRAAGVAWIMPICMLVSVLSRAVLVREAEWMQTTGVDWGQCHSESTTSSRWGDEPSELVTPLPQQQSARSYFEAMAASTCREGLQPDTMKNAGSLSWPSSLRQLSIGCVRNDRIDWTALPGSLERLAVGGCFRESIQSVAWPASLTRLTLGGWFNNSIANVAWPASLLRLTFGRWFNQPIADVVWPASLLQLTFGSVFDQPIADDVVWPPSLLNLAFGKCFDQPIADVSWPCSLRQLAFGGSFNQPISDVAWPASLNQLEFGRAFNRPIAEVVWPTDLQSLEFGVDFDQPVEGVAWPAALRWLTLSCRIAKKARVVVWPASLEPISFRNEVYEQDGGSDCPPRDDSFDNPDTVRVEDL